MSTSKKQADVSGRWPGTRGGTGRCGYGYVPCPWLGIVPPDR